MTLNLLRAREIFPATPPHEVFLVGGSVRDLLLGRRPTDLDLAVTGEPLAYARRLATHIGGRLVALGKPGLMLYRVVHGSQIIDISAVAGRSIAEDLRRRDFTINALAVDMASGEIIDVCGGRGDLAAGRVRMVSGSAFEQDPVRLIRAFRMAAVLRFDVTPDTAAAVRDQALLITRPAGERIRTELLKILETPRAANVIKQMADCGLLPAMLPELAELRGHRSNQKRFNDRFAHTLEAFSELENLLANPHAIIPVDVDRAGGALAAVPGAVLKLAILLHELVRAPNDRYTLRRLRKPAPKYDGVGTICTRLKLSKRQAHYVDFISRNHNWPLLLFDAHRRNRLSARAVGRFFMSVGDKTPDLILHAAADVAAGTGDTRKRETSFTGFAQYLLRHYFTDFLPRSGSPPLLTGRDLIELVGLRPAPVFKFLLTRIETDRLVGRLNTKDEAIRRVKQILARRQASHR